VTCSLVDVHWSFRGTHIRTLPYAYSLLVSCLACSSTSKMEAVRSSETSVNVYRPLRGQKSSVFWDILPCSPLNVTDVSEEHVASIFRTEEGLCLLFAPSWCLAWLILRTWRWKRHAPPKRLSVLQWSVKHYISEDRSVHNHRSENLKF
jgi:hypothetical protein